MAGGRGARTAVGISRRRDRDRRDMYRWFLIAGVAILGGLVSLYTVRGFQISNLRQQLQASALAYDQAIIERQDLQNQLELTDDLTAIEEAVRERLGWVRLGEERVIFIEREKQLSDEGE